MNIVLLALVVGVLFASGTFLILRRSPIRLVLGLTLLSHGVNLLLFSTSTPLGGMPPIIADKEAFDGDVAGMVDPLPQALILTAIVISFGVTAFTVVLINRRNSLSESVPESNNYVPSAQVPDPFAPPEYYISGLDQETDDYEWLEYSIMSEYRSAVERRQKQQDKMTAEDTDRNTDSSTDSNETSNRQATSQSSPEQAPGRSSAQSDESAKRPEMDSHEQAGHPEAEQPHKDERTQS